MVINLSFAIRDKFMTFAMKLIKLFNIKYLHLISIIGILCIYIVAGIAYIDDEVAYINLLDHKIEIGKCFYREHYDLDCPSCGLTRSFISVENFKIIESINYNKVGFLVYIMSILMIIFNVLSLKKSKYAYQFGVIISVYGVIVAILLAAFWLIKVFVFKQLN